DLRLPGGIPWWSVAQVMIICVCYAVGPFIIDRRLRDVPPLGVTAVALSTVAIVTAPFAFIAWPATAPPATTWWAIIALAVICTGTAFLVYFALIASVGPARATLITFVNPAVAVIAGRVFLDERITVATLGGFILVLAGCVLATRPGVSASSASTVAPSRR
ncbi:MAG TPA: DMT family transporter, partial [Acidimicrobiia bacterium]|nr:DMT family transporter [Acidimicrobiia bacterium]